MAGSARQVNIRPGVAMATKTQHLHSVQKEARCNQSLAGSNRHVYFLFASMSSVSKQGVFLCQFSSACRVSHAQNASSSCHS